LDEILEKYLPKDQKIDFLSIDVEGMDLNVLRSNNFKKYRPKVILIEILRSNLSNIENNEITNFTRYRLSYLCKTVNTIFLSNEAFMKIYFNNLSPIVLFVYNRPWHTRQTVEALQKNELAEESELFIFFRWK